MGFLLTQSRQVAKIQRLLLRTFVTGLLRNHSYKTLCNRLSGVGHASSGFGRLVIKLASKVISLLLLPEIERAGVGAPALSI